MFETAWAQKEIWQLEKSCSSSNRQYLSVSNIKNTSLLYWEEHCSECAAPYCYASCLHYVARADKECCNFAYGIYLNSNFNGLFDFGADVKFRKWGKLETVFHRQCVSVFQHRILQKISSLAENIGNSFGNITKPVNIRGILRQTKINAGINFFKIIPKSKVSTEFDEFVLSCFSPEEEPFRLIFECADEKTKFREFFNIVPGTNFYTIPAKYFDFESCSPEQRISIYPENSNERRLIFTWLDFVKYKKAHKIDKQPPDDSASKVKCIAWDLDNTLWKGILAESGESNLTINTVAIDLIKKFDERGIIQTIVSKNNFADAWPVIENSGLQDYFIYPEINWNHKSINLKVIADKLNININSLALIDDSPFERAEVKSALPQVRVYSAEQMPEIPGYDEFDSPVTMMSKLRRSSYQAEIQRNKQKEAFSTDYDSFLRSCKMKMRLFAPRNEDEILRCLELIQRTNQLNLSNKRYTKAEFAELLMKNNMLCVAVECADRFGNYGIVGFASIDEGNKDAIIKDLVFSCRIMSKRAEQTFLEWLALRESQNGKCALLAEIVKTKLNSMLIRIIEEMSFELIQSDGTHLLMKLPLDKKVKISDIIDIKVDM